VVGTRRCPRQPPGHIDQICRERKRSKRTASSPPTGAGSPAISSAVRRQIIGERISSLCATRSGYEDVENDRHSSWPEDMVLLSSSRWLWGCGVWLWSRHPLHTQYLYISRASIPNTGVVHIPGGIFLCGTISETMTKTGIISHEGRSSR
jgi:hypothetical protein